MAEKTEQELTQEEKDRLEQERQIEENTRALAASIRAAEAMKAEEAALPSALPTQTPPAAPPVPPPQPKIYMGPNITPQQFQALPTGVTNRLGPPPVLSPQQQMALQSRLARGTGYEPPQATLARLRAGDRPGVRTLSVMPETRPEVMADASRAQMQFEATQGMRRAIANGMPYEEAFRQFAPAIFGQSAMQKPLTAYQQAQIARWNKKPEMTPYQQAQVSRWRSEPSYYERKEFDAVVDELNKKREDLSWRDPETARAKALMEQISDLEAKLNRMKKGKAAPADKETPVKTLTRAKAEEFKRRAGGNRSKAEELARKEGYTW